MTLQSGLLNSSTYGMMVGYDNANTMMFPNFREHYILMLLLQKRRYNKLTSCIF